MHQKKKIVYCRCAYTDILKELGQETIEIERDLKNPLSHLFSIQPIHLLQTKSIFECNTNFSSMFHIYDANQLHCRPLIT